jgi:ribosomal protein S18 acetylase RimI-like enzyme
MNFPIHIKLVVANSPQEFDDGRLLFQEFANALDYKAGFQDFKAELKALPERYAPLDGALVLAYYNNIAVGCVAVRKMAPGVAELKRFYVQPAFRKFKIGAKLLEQANNQAKHLQFQAIRLEVIPSLTKAKELYRSFGFLEIAPYQKVSLEGTAYMEKKLSDSV